jgi:TRAP-type C4-dicarboxylate transport system substrate-binding protein
MKKSFKSMALAAAGLTVLMGSTSTLAQQQVTLRVHHFLPSTSSAQVRFIQPWCDKIAKESDNRLKCQIYPAMQLGGTPTQLYDQMLNGAVDIVWTVPSYSTGRFTRSEVFELPWMTSSAKVGSQAFWTYIDKFAQEEYKGVYRIFMHTHDGALLHFSKAQPKTLEDMKGLKVRAATRVNAKMLSALGATPVTMPLPAVPESLSKGVVDGASVPWEATPSIKLEEVAKYHFDVPAGAPRMSTTIFLFGMNQAKYDSLPPDLKKVIDANSGLGVSGWVGQTGFDEVVGKYKALSKSANGTLYDMPDAEYQRWIKATEVVIDDWVKEAAAKGIDGKKLIEEARALVKQYSN